MDQEKETGVLRLPQTDRRRIDSSGVGYHPWVDRPNMLAKYSFRVNLQSQLLNNLDVQFQTNYINLYQRFTLESNATAGLGSQAFGGPGYKTNGLISGVNTPLNGYRAWTPGYTWQERNDQGLNRLLMSVNLNWRPTSWLQNRVNLGTDFTDAVNGDLLFRESIFHNSQVETPYGPVRARNSSWFQFHPPTQRLTALRQALASPKNCRTAICRLAGGKGWHGGCTGVSKLQHFWTPLRCQTHCLPRCCCGSTPRPHWAPKSAMSLTKPAGKCVLCTHSTIWPNKRPKRAPASFAFHGIAIA